MGQLGNTEKHFHRPDINLPLYCSLGNLASPQKMVPYNSRGKVEKKSKSEVSLANAFKDLLAQLRKYIHIYY